MVENQTTETPVSCGMAWIKFSQDADLYDGSPTGNRLDDMQLAFDAGWDAALAALGLVGKSA